jgi:hypothetical protein
VPWSGPKESCYLNKTQQEIRATNKTNLGSYSNLRHLTQRERERERGFKYADVRVCPFVPWSGPKESIAI